MKIRVASDLHIKRIANVRQALADEYLPVLEGESEQTLILAGDVTEYLIILEEVFAACSERFNRVIYVPGNHERYRHDYHAWTAKANALKLMFPNIFAAMDGVERIELDGVRFIYGTLWTLGGRNLEESEQIQSKLYDFSLIDYKNDMFTVADMAKICNEQINAIDSFLAEPTECKSTVVITHHLPSFSCCAPRFGGFIDGGFASNFDHLINKRKPDYWIFGHTHDTIFRKHYDTMMVCNPAGYPSERLSAFNSYFRVPCVLEV